LNHYFWLMKVEVVQARSLMKADGPFGKSDPYCIIEFDDNADAAPKEARTHVIDKTLEPQWNSEMYFLVSDDCKSFKAKVYDKDVVSDDSLGHTTVLRNDKDSRNERKGGWLALEKGKNGQIQIFITEIPLRSGISELRAEKADSIQSFIDDAKVEGLSLLEVTLHSGENIKGGGLIGKPDPYAKIKFDSGEYSPSNEELKTPVQKNTNTPIWDSTFHFLINSATTRFTVNIWDEDVVSDDSLGHATVVIGLLNELHDAEELATTKKGILKISHVKVPAAALF